MNVAFRLCRAGLLAALLLEPCAIGHANRPTSGIKLPPEYFQALRLIAGGEYHKAILECERLVQEHPQFERGYEALVDAYEGNTALDKAVGYLQTLVTDDPRNGYAWYALGLAYQRKGDYRRSAEYLKESIDRSTELPAAFLEIAYAHRRLGTLKEFRPHLETLIDRQPQKAAPYYGLGCLHHFEGDSAKALEYFDKAIALDPTLLDAYRFKGEIHYRHGGFQESLTTYRQLLTLAESTDDRWYVGNALTGLGANSDGLGDYTRAVQYYHEALRAHEAIGNKQDQARTLNNLGVIYERLGDFLQATRAYHRVLPIYRSVKDRRGEATTLHNIGVIHSKKRAFAIARRYYERALPIRRETRDTQGEAATLNDIGVTYAREGREDEALIHLRQALELRRAGGNKLGESMSLHSIGYVHERRGEYEQAVSHQAKALELAEPLQHKETIWRTRAALAKALEGQQKLTDALAHYERSIETIEAIRAGLRSDEYKTGFFESKVRVFEDIVDLLYRLHVAFPEQGYDRQSFRYAEKGKARAFLELVAGSSPTTQGTKLPTQTTSADPEPHDLARARGLALVEDAAIGPSAGGLRKHAVTDNSILVEFMLGEERSFAWLIAPHGVQLAALPKRELIETRVRAYHKLLSNPPDASEAFSRWRRQGQELSRVLFGPLEIDWHHAATLVIVPDGILNYLPFETLVMFGGSGSRTRSLIETHQIAYAPSVSLLAALKARKRTDGEKLELLAFGDPSMESGAPVRGGSGRTFERLPYTRDEVQSLAALYPVGRRRIYLGARAAESTVKKENLAQYRKLHFATHGLVDEEVPSRSGLVLSRSEPDEDGILQVAEIMNLRLDADLVVLSACQSGLGRFVKGEGILGLTRAFIVAGASNLVVSLWNVNDESTAEFMASFYRHLKSGKTTTAALNAAKRQMMRSATPAYRFPYYWAPFVLIGAAN